MTVVKATTAMLLFCLILFILLVYVGNMGTTCIIGKWETRILKGSVILCFTRYFLNNMDVKTILHEILLL